MNKNKRKRLPVSVSAAVFIEDEQGKLLLVRQAVESKGYKWGPPAGGMKAYEDPTTTALRETREEIGVEVELVDLIGIYTACRGANASGISFNFRGKILGGEIKTAKDEIMNYRYFTPEEIQTLIEKKMLYKPEYNIPSIKDWLRGCSYPLDVVKTSLVNCETTKQKMIKGMPWSYLLPIFLFFSF